MPSSSNPMKWYHLAMLGGGVVSIGAVLYYLMREDSSSRGSNVDAPDSDKIDINNATKEQLEKLLLTIIESQDQMKKVMKDLTTQLCSSNEFGFTDVYSKVKAVQPEDPLEAAGLSMAEFDQLLDQFKHEPSIHESIGRIMGAPGQNGFSTRVTGIKKDIIVEIHEFMAVELQKLTKEFKALPNVEDYDMKSVTITVQAIVATHVERKYHLDTEDIEAAVLLHHQALASDARFAQINVLMQTTMSELMGSQFQSDFY